MTESATESVESGNYFESQDQRVRLGTVHSVKGLTLTAILVLESYIYTHDMEELISRGFLSGAHPGRVKQVRLGDHIRRMYVAMTRPTDLLCIAVHAEHVDDKQRTDLERCGWHIAEV